MVTINTIKRVSVSAATLFTGVFLALGSPVQVHALSTYDNDVINDGAVDYWKMDRATGEWDNLVQTSLNPMTGVGNVNTNTPSSSDQLVAGDSYSDYMDGTNSSAWVGTGDFQNHTGSISEEAWIKPASIPTTDVTGIAGKQGAYGFMFDYERLAFYVQGTGGSRQMCVDYTDTISAGTTYHLVGTWSTNSQTEKFYVNGSLVCSTSGIGFASLSQNAMGFVTGSWDTSVLFFDGDISNVALYNGVLDATIVSSHYSDGSL